MLEKVDLTKQLPKEEYKKLFPPLQNRLRSLQQECREAGIATLVVFEGWDASGKGSKINLMLEKLDPRGFKVHPASPPSIEEMYRPFLWRFWNKLPGYGEIAIFDRSWYGRVLVERIDKLVSRDAWERAYQEINDFERTLVDDGQVIVKFFMHISKKEQKKRFRKCEKDPVLRWKVTQEDWKHHREYEKYYRATEEMLERTSTQDAPWHLIEAEDRRWAAMELFRILIEAMESRLKAKVEEARLKALLAKEKPAPKQEAASKPEPTPKAAPKTAAVSAPTRPAKGSPRRATSTRRKEAARA